MNVQQQLAGQTAVVTGASRGFGRAIAMALAEAGASVVGIARHEAPLLELRDKLGGSFMPVTADAADPVNAGRLLDQHDPDILVLNAGVSPLSRPVHQHTWESFSRVWDVDVRQAFHWTREALLRPLRPGSVVVEMSSGAALFGSPLSGGYAGAKGTIRFIASYAAAESQRAGLGIRFVAVLPQLTPATELGAAAVAAYAAREGMSVAEFTASRGPALTPEFAGASVTQLIADPELDQLSYLLSADGLKPLPAH
jgi:NAD(P)-dependent dehydrogenase (short-subunit alcohol dehydrogenase family)